jgi:hypothetical protein
MFGFTPTTETYFFTSAATTGSVASGPSASAARVFSRPYRVMVAEPASDRSGNVIPRCRLKLARIPGGS